MKHTIRFLIIVPLLALAQGISCCYALDLPDEAFQYLAGAAADPCSICAKQKVKKALSILDKKFVPGTVIRSDGGCRLVKTGSSGLNELAVTCYPSEALVDSLKEGEQPPQLIFAFYTGQDKLIGISDKDCTGKGPADLFHASKQGTVFVGELKLIAYKYGDGPAYNYFQQANRLQVHCIIERLTPVSGN